jgi:hypothetical protein
MFNSINNQIQDDQTGAQTVEVFNKTVIYPGVWKVIHLIIVYFILIFNFKKHMDRSNY